MANVVSILCVVLLQHALSSATGCNYYQDDVTIYPIGICTGAKFYKHKGETDRSVLYLCADDNSHVIQYEYDSSPMCRGEYTSSIATSDDGNFVCGAEATCPYVVSTVHNIHGKMTGDVRKWYSSAWITDHCVNGNIYSCADNAGYTVETYDNENCDGEAMNSEIVAATDDLSYSDYQYYDVFCNQPDPLLAVLSLPQDSETTSAIETAICLDGRSSGKHKEIADNMASYCFMGYDAVNQKPVYKGKMGEIRWTALAGGLGQAFGLFLYGSEENPADGYPIAYCFSGDTLDISVCSGKWYMQHGTSPRYYMDSSMKVSKCECNVDEDRLQLSAPSIEGAQDEDQGPVVAAAELSIAVGYASFNGMVVACVVTLFSILLSCGI